MNKYVILKMFIVFPIMHFILAYGIITSSHWYLILIFGFLLHYPLHQLGGAIGYHKVFSHRAFIPKRWFVYLATFICTVCFIGDPLTYAVLHRIHHKYADSDLDPHSPNKGRFYAYIGWIATYKPKKIDMLLGIDLMREYPWMLPFKKIEWIVPLVVYSVLFVVSPLAFYIVLFAALLSIHSMFVTNAFGHDPAVIGTDKSIDIKWMGKYINPIFLHKNHHTKSNSYDYGCHGIKDYSVGFIERILTKNTK